MQSLQRPDIPYLHDLILELGEEEVHNLVLLDGERVQVDLLHGLDLASLDETAKLGNWLPLLLLVLVGATAGTTASASAVTTSTVSSTVCTKKVRLVKLSAPFTLRLERTTAGSETTATSCCSTSCCVGHVD